MDICEHELSEWTEQVRRFLIKRLGNRSMAQDLAHEATTRLLQTVRARGLPADPRAWLFRTARNLAIDEVRRHLPRPLGLEALGKIVDPDSVPLSEGDWELGKVLSSREELLDLLPKVLGQLPAHYRRLIQAHYHLGLGCEEVARQEQITVANAKVRLFRARRQLHQLLQVAAESR